MLAMSLRDQKLLFAYFSDTLVSRLVKAVKLYLDPDRTGIDWQIPSLNWTCFLPFKLTRNQCTCTVENSHNCMMLMSAPLVQ